MNCARSRRSWCVVALAALLLPLALPARAQTVFAAASLTNAMKSVAAAWANQGHPKPVTSFAASSTLARQIEQGAPANIFASADERWMNYLADHHMIVAASRKDLLANHLVLIVPANNPINVAIKPDFDLARILGAQGRLAVGDPSNVPAGIYAKQALTKLGVWSSVQQKLAPAEDVRAALLLVERGEAAAGVVYETDAKISHAVRIAGVFPPGSHPPILYPVAIVHGGDTAQARALLAFIEGTKARAIFARYGFSPP